MTVRTQIREYNSAVIAAKKMEIFDERTIENLLVDPIGVTGVYKRVLEDIGTERFKEYIKKHIEVYLNIFDQKPSDEVEAIKKYNVLLLGYFGDSMKIIDGRNHVNIIMERCPYSELCSQVGCIRKIAIEKAVEVLTGNKTEIKIIQNKYSCALSYNSPYDDVDTMKLFEVFDRLEEELHLMGRELTGDKIIKEGLKESIKFH